MSCVDDKRGETTLQPKPKNPVWFTNTFHDDGTTTISPKQGRKHLAGICAFLVEACAILANILVENIFRCPFLECATRSRRAPEPNLPGRKSQVYTLRVIGEKFAVIHE